MQITIADTYKVPLGRNARYGYLTVDHGRLPEAVREHVWEYGLRQVLNDAIASKAEFNKDGKKVRDYTDDELFDKAAKKLETLYAGELRSRSAGEPVDPFEAACYSIAINRLTLWAKAIGKDVPKDIKAKDRLLYVVNRERAKKGREDFSDIGEAVDAMLEGPLGDTIREEAQALVDAAGQDLGF